MSRIPHVPRQEDAEGRPAAELALDGDGSPEDVEESADYVQPEPSAAVPVCNRPVGLPEWLEDDRLRFGCNSNTRVGHDKLDAPVAGRIGADGDIPLFFELHCVADQILEHHLELDGIRVDCR